MTNAEMWKICVQAASMLDGAASDWRRLLAIETTLSPLATELDRAVAANNSGSRRVRAMARMDPDLSLLQSALSWVRQHEYDALESELESRLEGALVSAMNTLHTWQQSRPHHEGASALPSMAVAAHAVAGQLALSPQETPVLLLTCRCPDSPS
jgi:hypothetical protein